MSRYPAGRTTEDGVDSSKGYGPEGRVTRWALRRVQVERRHKLWTVDATLMHIVQEHDVMLNKSRLH